jgi:Abortive infection alpha
LGTALGTVFETSSTFVLPLKLWQARRKAIFQSNINKLEQQLAIAADEGKTIVPCPPEIGCSVIDQLGHVSDPELSELFVRLLRRSCIKEESKLAHPRFVSIISSLSPDEARLLKATSHEDFFRCLSVRWEKTESDEGGIATTSYYITDQCQTAVEQVTDILFTDNIYKYLVSLQSLGLLVIQEDAHIDEYMTPHADYIKLRKFYKTRAKENVKTQDGHTSRVLHGRIQFTDFGLFFLDSCVRSGAQTRKRRTKPLQQSTRYTPGNVTKDAAGPSVSGDG